MSSVWRLKDKGKSITWIDITRPSKDDVEALKKEHKFHPIILDELLQPSERSRVEFYNSYLFLTYHLPIYDHELKTSRRAEVDFLITKGKIVTVHYEKLEPLESLKRSINNNPVLKKHVLQNSLQLFYHILQEVISFSSLEMRHIEESVTYVSQEIFKGNEGEMLETISYVKRDVLDYSVISEPQEIVLKSLIDVGDQFWGGKAAIYLNDLVGDHHKALQQLKNMTETIKALETTNAQLLSAKTNLVMQKFTILAFLTFPLFLFFSLISVDFVGKHVLASPMRFWSTLVIVGTVVTSIAVYFRKKGWL